MWSYARSHGISSDEFWDMMPCEFHAIIEQHSDRAKHEDYRFGLLASLFHNANRGKDTKALGPDDFFPSLKAPVTEKPVDIDRSLEWTAWAKAYEARKQQQDLPFE